jgi:hypothetical protein
MPVWSRCRVVQGVTAGLSGDFAGTPAKALAAVAEGQRLFAGLAVVLASGLDSGSSGKPRPALCHVMSVLLTLGGGLVLQLQPGSVSALAPNQPGGASTAQQASRGTMTQQQRQQERRQLQAQHEAHWWQRQQQPAPGVSGGGWRRIIIVAGDCSQAVQAQLRVRWGTDELVSGHFVVDAVVSWQLPPLRVPPAGRHAVQVASEAAAAAADGV